ncbi:uncharacterized protein VTP21DRAFT_4661 [Calcarisporiella thermophila]|uniref:uncharacterized protein n=1 Tax=Calcarisporiella thermophila TaxID=911321 RepID=UPI003742E2C5
MSSSSENDQDFVFPPSPNWYSAQLCDYSPALNLFVYAARSLLYLLDSRTLIYRGRLLGHTQRINGVAIAPDGKKCASAGTDQMVRVWSLEKMHSLGVVDLHKSEVLAITWINDTTLISGDKNGQLFLLDIDTAKYTKFSFLSSAVYCLAAFSDMVAVGYQNGTIAILKAKMEEISALYQLQGHDDEIHSLSWQPPISEARVPYLSSGARDKTIRIWDVPEEKELHNFSLPKAKGHYTEQQKSRLWVTTTWSLSNPNILFSSSYMGDLLSWNINARREKPEKFGEAHSRCIFKILMTEGGKQLITISMDRQIALWDAATRKPLLLLSALGGHVYSLSLSQPDPSQLALGLGDNTLRIWNHTSSANPYSSISLWKGLKAKVTRVAWHPTREGIIAYSTDIGGIGVGDCYSGGSGGKLVGMKGWHRDKVYALCWGRRPQVAEPERRNGEEAGIGEAKESSPENHGGNANEEELVLYSCGGGVVFISDPAKPNKAPVDLDQLIEKSNPGWANVVRGKTSKAVQRTEVIAHPRGTHVAIGNADGSIEVYSLPALKFLYWFNGHTRLINRLRWCDTSEGYWLASGADDGMLGIHNLTDTSVCSHDTAALPIPTSSCFRFFKAHKNGLTDIVFRPSNPLHILTTSFDGFAVVWNIIDGSRLAQFRGHENRILCAAWNVLDEDVIWTGGDDQVVFGWRISRHPYRPQEPSPPSEEDNKVVVTEFESTANSLGGNEGKESVRLVSETNIKTGGDRKKRGKKTKANLFPLSTSAFMASPRRRMQEECFLIGEKLMGKCVDVSQVIEKVERLAAMGEESGAGKDGQEAQVSEKLSLEKSSGDMNGDGERKAPAVVDLVFGETQDIYRLVDTEAKNHESTVSSPLNLAIPLELWRGNVAGMLNTSEAESTPTLQDWVKLAFSPLAGRDVWVVQMRKLAERLKRTDPHLSAMCFLACSDPISAVAVYRQEGLYREAIALAKLRVPDADALVGELLVEWAGVLEDKGHYEQAAKCYLASGATGSVQHALNALSRRGDMSALRAAACLATLMDDPSKEERLARYIALRNKKEAESGAKENPTVEEENQSDANGEGSQRMGTSEFSPPAHELESTGAQMQPSHDTQRGEKQMKPGE